MDDFQESTDLLLRYLRGIWKNRWIAVAVAWPLMLVGVAVVDQIKDQYVAETKVYLDSSSILRPLLKGLAIETDFNAIVQLMVRRLLSRPNLERAIRLMEMDRAVKTPEGMEALTLGVRKRIEVSANKNTGIYQITYSDTDRIIAKRMVQTLLDIFIEDTKGKSTVESDSAIAFLDQQIEKYNNLLKQAEERREVFKRKNIGLMPNDGAGYYAQLQQVDTELDKIDLKLGESISRRDKLRSNLMELTEGRPVDEGPVNTIYDQQIIEHETRLGDLLLQYTDEHPDVINAKLVLDTLRTRRAKELAVAKPPKQIEAGDNKVLQEIQILLAKTDADISSLQTRRSSFIRKKKELRKVVEIVPKIEAELQQLNRDYEVHKQNYTELVQRREKARISEDVESGTEQVKFRVIEPPFVPLSPSYPNRVIFDIVVLIAAVGTGYGLSLLISLFQPVYYSLDEIRKAHNYTVLGAVKKFDTATTLSARRGNLIVFVTINFLMVLSLLIVIYLHGRGILVTRMLLSEFS